MLRIGSDGAGQTVSHSRPARGLLKTYVFAVALGVAFIGALTSYVIHRYYQATLTLWRSRLSSDVLNRVWLLQVSLDQTEQDMRFLAEFAPTRELLLGPDESATRSPRAALLSQVMAT